MGGPPDATRARRESLERWAAEHQEADRGEERASPAKRWSRHAGLRVALNLQRAANRLLGRGLDTSSHVKLPEHDHPVGLAFAASRPPTPGCLRPGRVRRLWLRKGPRPPPGRETPIPKGDRRRDLFGAC